MGNTLANPLDIRASFSFQNACFVHLWLVCCHRGTFCRHGKILCTRVHPPPPPSELVRSGGKIFPPPPQTFTHTHTHTHTHTAPYHHRLQVGPCTPSHAPLHAQKVLVGPIIYWQLWPAHKNTSIQKKKKNWTARLYNRHNSDFESSLQVLDLEVELSFPAPFKPVSSSRWADFISEMLI